MGYVVGSRWSIGWSGVALRGGDALVGLMAAFVFLVVKSSEGEDVQK